MKRIFSMGLLAAAALALSSCATKTAALSGDVPVYHTTQEYPYSYNQPAPVEPVEAAPSASTESAWPRSFSSGNSTGTIYQPQIDSWDGYHLAGRSAVSVQTPDHPQPIFGVITFKAITLVDKSSGTAALDQLQVVGGNFPSAHERSANWLALFRETLPKQTLVLSVNQLQANFDTANLVKPKAQPLNNSPPKIIISTQPALVVFIDGAPAYRPVSGTELQRVINTHVLLLKDSAGRNYLHVLDGYMQAPTLAGPWTVASEPPKDAALAEQEARASNPADLLEGQPDPATGKTPSLRNGPPPVIYVETTPTELITFDGPPDFVPIPGTQLLYAANTSGNVFTSLSDQQNYVLISGRWFRAPSLNGPWQYVLGGNLPPDFAHIPDSSPKENVKASVPGTRQSSEEALIANSIPQTTKVSRTATLAAPQFDGTPQLAPIEGTPLFYVANSGTPIIKVDDHSWYACQNGVWYAATSVQGPWVAAASVPAVIYSIPPSSPLHYLTYVRVYDSTPETVYEGYTPGYLGTEVESDGVVVYGTGYYYRPWIGGVWFCPPLTWGFGWDYCWTPWWGWCYDFGFGWDCGYGRLGWWRCYPRPWWGPYRAWTHRSESGIVAWRTSHTLNTAANVYAPSRPSGSRTAGFAAAERAGTYGRAYNSRTGQLAAGQTARVRNIYSSRDWGFEGAPGWNGHGSAPPARSVLTRRNAESAGRFNGNSAGWYSPKSSFEGSGRAPARAYSSGGNGGFYQSPSRGGESRSRGDAERWGGGSRSGGEFRGGGFHGGGGGRGGRNDR